MRKGLIAGCIIAAASIVAGANTATAATAPGAHSPRHLLGLHAAPGESPAAAIADAVQKVAESQFAGEYDGEVLTGNGSRVTVYLTRLDSAAEEAMTAGIQPGVVSFAKAPRSLAYLDRLHQQVSDKTTWLRQHGINIVTWGPDFITGRENVTVQDLTPAKRTELGRIFGAANLTLTTTSRNYTAYSLPLIPETPIRNLRIQTP